MDPGPRPVLRGLSLLFYVASGLVLLATVQLFVLSGQTDRYFAWRIAAPLTAAVDGAFYLAAFFLLFRAARARTWAEVVPITWGVLAVSTLKLVATLRHLRLFHFTKGVGTARVAAWGWLAVYVLVPIGLVVLIAAELRTAGASSPSNTRAESPFRWIAGFLSLVLLAVGVLLLLAPGREVARWPWPLTDLTSQALSAWFVGIGIVAGLAVLDGDISRTRRVWSAALILAVLQGVALARYANAVEWSSAAAWGYVALFVLVGVVGAWGWLASSGQSDRTAPNGAIRA